ncbi:hypothetical protein [Ideonella livida]|uniref:Alpha/beta hydrolase n=1 Tax=Ideonella livida TaxID=2707176 RepID=A0A7C9PES0_9BURK|nr:hypothetical protein [Ideonella livida]NDY89955.1 hypothetical protein [Ideonella livida]
MPPHAPKAESSLHLLFEDADCQVWTNAWLDHSPAGRVCVALSPRHPRHPPVFGQKLFDKRQLPAVFIQPRRSNWYQFAAMPEVCALIRRRIGARPVFTYGSSMGGFGAVLAAGWLNADIALAVSPQVSIARDRVGDFETRWQQEAQALTFLWPDARAMIQPEVRHVLAFDPTHGADRRHARLLMAQRPQAFHALPVWGGGHPVGPALGVAGALSALVEDIARGQIGLEEALRAARQRYRQSPVRPFVVAMALNAISRKRRRHQGWAKAQRVRTGIQHEHRPTPPTLKACLALGHAPALPAKD